MKFCLIFIFIITHYIAFSQENNEISVQSQVNSYDGSKRNVNTIYNFDEEKFYAIGITIPPFTNWQLGIPHFAFDQSLFHYKSTRLNLTWFTRLTAPFIVYDVIGFDNSPNYFIFDYQTFGTYYFRPSIKKRTINKKLALGYTYTLYGDSKMPIIASKKNGVNIGIMCERQFTNDGFPFSYQGISFGYSKKTFSNVSVVIYDEIKKNQIPGNWIAGQYKLNRVFYLNSSVGFNYKLHTKYDYTFTVFPFGLNMGWIFFNQKKFKTGFFTWNLELGIKNPIITDLPQQSSTEMAMFYFTYRGFVGGLYPSKK